MKRWHPIWLLLFVLAAPLLSYSQENSNLDFAVIDKQIKQFAAILNHDGRDLETTSSDLIQIFLLMAGKDQGRWHLQSAIHNINEIAKIMEHEALLINIGLDYISANEKQLFYKNILKSRLEQYRKEIHSALESILNGSFLITDEVAIDHIQTATEIGLNTLKSHDRYIQILKSLETGALRENSLSSP